LLPADAGYAWQSRRRGHVVFEAVKEMLMGLILLIILIVLLLGAVPTWPYSRSWGYGPSGVLGLLLVILLVLMLFQVIAPPWGPTFP
jgi:Protein of unknown function (DUF3309)